jgi:hypothetical protein
VTYTIRPISDRTRFTGKHQRSNFDTPWPATEDLLMREVRHLGGRHLVIEADFTESDIRIDGRVRASARPSTPAIRIAFESVHGPLTYATDRFSTWQDNVRAIALGLEALRKVDRYGITKKGEQYAGWKALPGGNNAWAPVMDVDLAWATIGSYGEGPIAQQRANGDARAAYRKARAATHPDRHGGDRELWDLVEQAATVLGIRR